jgi:HAD superfamily hydrolase (TIGR01509 family)
MAVLKALLWDVDGTIAETERDGHLVAFNRAFADAGLAWRWSDARYAQLLQVTGGRERLLADMATRADAPSSPEARNALARSLHHAKNLAYARLVSEGGLLPRPGVLALMGAAEAAGLAQAIVTTTSRSNLLALMGQLLGSGWNRQFTVTVCGEDVAEKKPHPAAYRLALQSLGCLPEHALAIEDSPAGLQAARAAGLAVLLRPSVYFPRCESPGSDCLQVSDDADFTWSRLAAWFSAKAA